MMRIEDRKLHSHLEWPTRNIQSHLNIYTPQTSYILYIEKLFCFSTKQFIPRPMKCGDEIRLNTYNHAVNLGTYR